MSFTIGSNIFSLNARRTLGRTNNALGVNFQRLASGLRVNSAKDDPAAIGITSRMTAQIRGLNVATKNANEGLSIAQVADSALEESINALQSIRDIASDATSSTHSTSDRTSFSDEIDELVSEVQRIAQEIEYNDQLLLQGGYTASIMIGADAGDRMVFGISGASANKIGLGVDGGNLSVDTTSNASTTVQYVDSALDSIATIRAGLGGVQSRFESVINTIEDLSDAYTTARSNILDADIAEETAALTRNVILQQAGVAVLAQANLQPQVMLQLLP